MRPIPVGSWCDDPPVFSRSSPQNIETQRCGAGKAICDKQAIAACYWGISNRYGSDPLVGYISDEEPYLADLCNSNPDDFPEDDTCKKDRYGSCTDAERKEFASMERGYASLRGEITSAESCQAVAQLHECMDMEVMHNCDIHMDPNIVTFEEQEKEENRLAQTLKVCVENAVKACDSKKNAVGISHLQKITQAIVDLSRLSDKPNAAQTTKAVTAVVVASLLSLAFRDFF
ncbi:hypothetical protein HPB50_006790 [Hyalomma asiaticum]|uniref:Uncharacterized protein n=1 Tax=Hyalomma asiaticum TaxID=266040 RepID=A0ACB7RHM0_HYAAI|nr:hypothetical protein HPB50_006790 [Hyalomma asiaticum]